MTTVEQRARIRSARDAVENYRSPIELTFIAGRPYHSVTLPPKYLLDELHAAHMACCSPAQVIHQSSTTLSPEQGQEVSGVGVQPLGENHPLK